MMRALSVWNPWAYALVMKRPNGKPFKPLENRTVPFWDVMKGEWLLIHVGLHETDAITVQYVYEMALEQGLSMMDWARTKSRAKVDGKPIGSIVGAVKIDRDLRPLEVTDPYDQLWVTPPYEEPDRRRCWMVADCIAFDFHIPCKGSRAPLLFEVPPEVSRLAEAALRGSPTV